MAMIGDHDPINYNVFVTNISGSSTTDGEFNWQQAGTTSGTPIPGIQISTGSTTVTPGTIGTIGSSQYYWDGSSWVPQQQPSPFLPPIQEPIFNDQAPPQIQVRLDARDMIDALRQYRHFLNDLEDMDDTLAQIVDDTIFGLNEAIEALERLGY